MTMGNQARDGQKTAGSLRVPEGAEWFAVEKLEKGTDKETGKTVEKYRTKYSAHPTEPGVKVTQVPIPPGGLNDAELRAAIAETWGYGFYRLRWSKGGRSTPFQIVDPDTAEAPSEALGGRIPPRVRTVGEDGGAASPIAAIELMPPEVQKGFAMIAALKQLTAGDLAMQQQQQQQHFQLMLEMVKESRQQGGGGGLDVRDMKIMLLETVAPLREELAAMKLENARMRREIADAEPEEEEDIDWEKPLGEILGIEVKKAIVDLAGELTPEVMPLVKVAVPAFLQNLRAEITKARMMAAKPNGVA